MNKTGLFIIYLNHPNIKGPDTYTREDFDPIPSDAELWEILE